MPIMFQETLNRQKNENLKISEQIKDLQKENVKLKREIQINEIEGNIDHRILQEYQEFNGFLTERLSKIERNQIDKTKFDCDKVFKKEKTNLMLKDEFKKISKQE